MKTADRRQLYVRALVLVRLHELREKLPTDAEQAELDRSQLTHARKMLRNTAKRLGLNPPAATTMAGAQGIITGLDRDGKVPTHLMEAV